MTAEDVKKLLQLIPHPCEGGWYIRTYESTEMLLGDAFSGARYRGPRRTGTAIYYLLEPHTFSEIHRLRSDEIFHFYAGDPVEMLQLLPNGEGKVVRIGTNLKNGERPQVVVPREVWQGSRLQQGGQWALLGCTVSPGFEFDDYEAGDREQLLAQWPTFADLISVLTHSR